MAEVDKACCSLPAVTTHDYKPKGTYTKLAGLDVYTTGSPHSTRALIAVYDIFGFASQTLQGADLLSHSLNAFVLIPDFFMGNALSMSSYPPDTDEKKKTVEEFRQKTSNINTNVPKLGEVAKEAKVKYEGVKGWGCYGVCWGGKMAVLQSGPGTEFKAAGTAHPGRLEIEDAEKLTIPFICLFSKEDGTPELVKEYTEVLEKNEDNVVEKYGSMHHGWMGARANLEDKGNLKEFERGYTQLADFFSQHL